MIPSTTDEWHLVSLAPWGRLGELLAIGAAVAVLVLAALALRREEHRWRRWLLLSLRAAAVGAALTLFFEPAIRLQNVTRLPNHVALLVDHSASMGLKERADVLPRSARAAAWLAASRPGFDAMAGQHRVDLYTFGDQLLPTTFEAERTSPPRAETTHLREALTALRSRYVGRDLAGVVVLSDGIDNGRFGEQLASSDALDAESLDFLRSLDVPIHTAWVGQPGLHDVAVARVLADDFAFVHTAIQVEAVVRVIGAADARWEGRTLPVTLRRDGVVLRTVDVVVEPGKTDYRVTFPFTPDRVGKFVYEISTPLLAGEAVAENNTRTFLINVIRDKIRVLQVAGRPSWDERFLRGLLKHNPNIDLISFFILRTPNDLESVPPEEMSLIPFPTEELFQEQLRSFDLVFLQNFNYGPYGIGAYLGQIKRYVEEGGGLAMLGGDLSFGSGGYARTPLADLLPIELPAAETPAERLVDLQPFRLHLTAEGHDHPLTALRVDVKQNEALWGGLPELEGTNLVVRARPGATVLGTHPSLKDSDGHPLPVLTVGEAGKGRVLALTSDTSWRWGFGASDDAGGRGRSYQRFWESAMRWLIHDPALSFLHIETDQTEYARGQPIHLTVRALNNDYRPLAGVDLSLAVARIAGSVGRPELFASRAGRTDEGGELHVELPAPPPGGYRVTARGTIGGRPSEEEEVFIVRGAGREMEELEARDGLLRKISAATGGSFRGPGDSLGGLSFFPPQIVRVNAHRDVEIWSGWWVLAVAAISLSLNWVLRRRWGYA